MTPVRSAARASAHPLPARPRKSNNGQLELLCTGARFGGRPSHTTNVDAREKESQDS